MDTAARTLEDLGYLRLQEALARRCRTSAGRASAARRGLLSAREDVEASLELVSEGRRLRQLGFRLPLDAVTDIREAVARAAKGGLLDPRELIAAAQTLFALDRGREGLATHRSAAPRLAAWGQSLPALEQLAARLDRSFEASGEISDRASRDLADARERARGLHRTIKAKLETLLRDEDFIPQLRESYYSLRNERYVLPVLAQHRADVPGIVHNASQSGQTLFVEPQALVGLGNDLAIAQSLVVEEERRVLLDLSQALGREESRIAAGVEAAARLDEVEAAASMSEELDATTPFLEPADGPLILRGVRHPLLALQQAEVVPNDVELQGETRALVISGPNAGGKTVTLSAIGLCALMVRAGLPIPAAEGSRIPLYRSIHSAIGDAQSLAEGLSTFSAHVVELRDIQRSANPGGLVLIDEIAADTDPEEGAALAAAFLDDLLQKGVTAVVTTHLEELKALAHVDTRFANARVGFDSRNRVPTYKLQMGMAGSSSAIELAERMGLSSEVCEKARDRLRSSGGDLARALRAVEEERQKVARESAALEVARKDAEASRNALLAEETTSRETIRRQLREQQQQLRTHYERGLAEAHARISSLRQAPTFEAVATIQSELREGVRELEEQSAAQPEAPARPLPDDLVVGQWVRHLGLGRDVEVLDASEHDVLVAAGALKLRVSRSDLGGSERPRRSSSFPDKARAPEQARSRAAGLAAAELELAGGKCDLRGMRAEDALRELEASLDRATRNGEATLRVVHGHGTGALKAAVREFLQGSVYVEAFRPGQSQEGGDGATVVTLRL